MNLFELPNFPLAEEEITLLFSGGNVRIERIISTGQISDWYDQEETEFVALLQGEAKLEYENGELTTLIAGDSQTILPHRRHKVVATSSEPPCVWLCVFWK